MCSGAQETGVSPALTGGEALSVPAALCRQGEIFRLISEWKRKNNVAKLEQRVRAIVIRNILDENIDWGVCCCSEYPPLAPATDLAMCRARPRVTRPAPARDTRGPTSSPGGGWANTNDCQPEIIPAPIIQGLQQMKNAHLFYGFVFLLSLVLTTRGN